MKFNSSRLLNLFGILALIGCFFVAQFCTSNTKQNQSIQSGDYTVLLSNGGKDIRITGAEKVTILRSDGTVVFPLTTTDTVPLPPIDTGKGRDILIGVNTNHYQPKERQVEFSGVRYYLPMGWCHTQFGFYGQPMKQGQKQFNGVDDYLAYMKSKGVDVLLCLMESPDYLNGQSNGNGGTNPWPPIRPGLDRTNPASYSEVANIFKTFSIRYGSKVWPAGSYKLDPAPPRWNGDERQSYKSGLNLVTYIEVGNELDRWWKIGTSEYMTPQEHAAMLIACYDSIKAADPKLKVVLGGLTDFDDKYLEAMRIFCTSRGRKFPADIINVHHYSSAGNIAGVLPPTWPVNQAIPVELDKNAGAFTKCFTFARILGLPIWVTEFGYDTQPGSQMTPISDGRLTGEQLQALWSPRAALEYLRLGADRVYIFTLADEPNPNAGLFTSSGLLKGENTGYVPKEGFASFAGLGKVLKGWSLASDQSTQSTRILKFKQGTRTLYAFWSPTNTALSFPANIGGVSVTVNESVQTIHN